MSGDLTRGLSWQKQLQVLIQRWYHSSDVLTILLILAIYSPLLSVVTDLQSLPRITEWVISLPELLPGISGKKIS
ncbi:hypothetical protein D3C86_1213970 [compost metagenome]